MAGSSINGRCASERAGGLSALDRRSTVQHRRQLSVNDPPLLRPHRDGGGGGWWVVVVAGGVGVGGR